jgi:hypothetical protein
MHTPLVCVGVCCRSLCSVQTLRVLGVVDGKCFVVHLCVYCVFEEISVDGHTAERSLGSEAHNHVVSAYALGVLHFLLVGCELLRGGLGGLVA